LDDRATRYLSCRFIESEPCLFRDFVKFCCVGDHDGVRAPRIEHTAGRLPAMELLERARRRLREANNGSRPPCDGCVHLERDSRAPRLRSTRTRRRRFPPRAPMRRSRPCRESVPLSGARTSACAWWTSAWSSGESTSPGAVHSDACWRVGSRAVGVRRA